MRKIYAILFALCFIGIGCFIGWLAFNKTDEDEFAIANGVISEAEKLISNEAIYSISEDTIIEGALKGMAEAIKDPYSVYYTEEEALLHKQSLASERVGIGIELTHTNGKFLIMSAVKKSPASIAGIAPLDELVQVDGEHVQGKSMETVLKMLQGNAGEAVKLTVYRPSAERHFTFSVERKNLPNETVEVTILEQREKKIGQISVHLFGESTFEEWVKALETVKKESVDGLIIDVRDNPGGYLYATTQMLSVFKPEGTRYAYMENARGEIEELLTVSFKQEELKSYLNKLPITILMNGGSASAAEVFTSALMAWDKAMVIGEKSFGKGTVQETWPLSNGGEMKLSTHKWLTLSREWIHQKGIPPHIEQSANPLWHFQVRPITEDYQLGEFSDDISYIQQILKHLGYTVSRTDGFFDEGTQVAVKQFRHNHGLIENNEIDASFVQTFLKVLEAEKLNIEKDPQIQMAISYIVNELQQ